MNLELNSSEFKVSVIIPVYNSASFVSEAVESAISLNDVGEVIIVEDGSSDDSLAVCNELKLKFHKVKVLIHPDGENRGVSASRNLGIQASKYPWVAFLDADDWYLPHRFIKDKVIVESSQSIDALYSCAILEEDQQNPEKRYGVKENPLNILGKGITDIEFYFNKLKRKWVLFNTNSITINRTFLLEDKLFDTRLALHQDTELWDRLLRRGHFVSAEVCFPVAVVRRHENNRITGRSLASLKKMIWVFIDNIGLESLYTFEINYLFMIILRVQSKHFRDTWKRRRYYYISYLLHCVNKKRYILKFYRNNAIN